MAAKPKKTAEPDKVPAEKPADPTKLDREALVKALTAVKPALGKVGGVMPAWGHFWFDGEYVAAYNGGLGIRLPFATKLDMGIPGEPLLKLLATSTLKEMSIEPSKGGVQLGLGRSRVQLTALPPEQRMWPYPAVDAPSSKWKAALTMTPALLEGLVKLAFIKVPQPTDAVHYGIAIFPTDKTLELYATDTLTLASLVIKEPPSPDLPDFIAPHPFVKQLLELAKPDDVLYVLSDCLLLMGEAGLLIGSSLLEFPEKPDMPNIVAEHAKGKGVPLPVELSLVLERAEILAGGQAQGLNLSISDGALSLKGKYAFGALDEEIPLTGKHPAVSASFVAEYIARGLTHADHISISKRALVLSGADGFVYIVSAHSAK